MKIAIMKIQAVRTRMLSLSFDTHWQGLTSSSSGNTSEVTKHYNKIQHFWLLLAFKNRNSQCSHNMQKMEITYLDRLKATDHLPWHKNTQIVNSDFSKRLSDYWAGVGPCMVQCFPFLWRKKRLHNTPLVKQTR